MGHANDAVVLPLLISPIVWNHHYLTLLPPLIWSCVVLGPSRWRSWLPIGAALVPYFAQPFVYISYLGVWLWLYQTSPRVIWNAVMGRDNPERSQDQAVSINDAPLI